MTPKKNTASVPAFHLFVLSPLSLCLCLSNFCKFNTQHTQKNNICIQYHQITLSYHNTKLQIKWEEEVNYKDCLQARI
jgi:hypothetical protein